MKIIFKVLRKLSTMLIQPTDMVKDVNFIATGHFLQNILLELADGECDHNRVYGDVSEYSDCESCYDSMTELHG